MTKLSIVTSIYHSGSYVKPFYERSLAILKRIGVTDYEFIIVDDGYRGDNGLQEAIALHKKDSNVRVIELSCNFGQFKALMTGLEYARGDWVFLIDSDLEEEPELLEIFWNTMHTESHQNTDVLYGVQEGKRKGRWFERWSGGLYYPLFNFFSDKAVIHKNIITARLMKRDYVKELMKMRDHEFYFMPICNLVGFNQVALPVKKKSQSPTNYSFIMKYNLLINSILSFSLKPLYFIFYFGLLLTIFSFSIGSFYIWKKLFFGVSVDGWTSLMVSTWFLGGTIILFLGIIAIYLSKVFTASRQRPFSIIRKIYEV